MRQLIMARRYMGILLFVAIVTLSVIGSLLGQTKKFAHKKQFELDPFDLLLEAEHPNGLRGIYVVHWLKDINNKRDNHITAEVKLIVPHGSRPRWSPQRNYILYERHGWIYVMDRKGNTVRGWMGGYPIYGWGPDDNAILIGAVRELLGLGFKTLWKEPWDTWENWKDMFRNPTIGIPGQYGITFSHPKLPDELWLGAPTMSPDWSMHAFEGYRPLSNYGRNYSKIYVVEWIEPPQYSKDHSWLPVWRLTALPDDLLEVNPKFSPDGKWIAFEVIDPKTSTHRVYLATPDGKVIRPIPLPYSGNGKPNPSVPESVQEWVRQSKRRYYEQMRYKIVKWLSSKKLLIRLEQMTLTGRIDDNNIIEFWLVNLDKKDDSKLFAVKTNVGLAVIHRNGEIAVTYNAPTPYHLGASLEVIDLKAEEGQKRYYIKNFPKDMIVYWMDW